MNSGLNKYKEIYFQRIFIILKLQMCIVNLQERAVVVRISYIFVPYKLLQFLALFLASQYLGFNELAFCRT